MTKRVLSLLSCMVLCGVLLSASYGLPQEGKISGYMLTDYYLVLANHNEDLKNQNGFWVRRIYAVYDKKIGEDFAARLRLEMNSPGDFETKATMSPVVKDAYLRWSGSLAALRCDHQIFVGLSSTPTFSTVEDVWGYRSVEKTPIDLHKFGSSRDIGIAVKSTLADLLKIHLMLGNGASNSSETDKHKKLLLSLGAEPVDGVTVEAYGDVLTGPEGKNIFTAQGFAAYEMDKGRVGVQFVHQTRQADPEDLKLELGSVFAVAKLMDKVSAFARYDMMLDPNPSGAGIDYIPFDDTAKSNFIVAGLDLSPHKDVHIIPNVELVIYGEPDAGDKPDPDVIPRLTFYYKF